MVKEQEQPDWSSDLIDSLWFHIGNYLTINDIDRLSRASSRLHILFTNHDFWSFLIRMKFGSAIWHRYIKDSSIRTETDNELSQLDNKSCRSKLFYIELLKRHCISFADAEQISLDTNRNYITIADSSSLNGEVLYINDSVEFCYSLHIETMFKNILPGRYDVICRIKLDLPYILDETEFIASAEQETNSDKVAYLRWTQDDFLSMYRCFNCDLTGNNLWFYQTIGIVEINGNEPSNVYVSIKNQDQIHSKHGVFLDYVELKLRSE